MSKCAALILIALLASLGLIMVKVTFAQSLPKPSVPEFTFKFLENYYDPTMEITIKNQPYASTFNGSETRLYYNFRTKSHLTENWTKQYIISTETLPAQSSYYNSTDLYYIPTNYNTGEEVDLQVEAILGYQEYTYVPDHPFAPPTVTFVRQSSGWSPTQTFTMPYKPALAPSPAHFYISETVLLYIIAAIATTALLLALASLLLYRRQKRKSTKASIV
jgi:hypothetical protein